MNPNCARCGKIVYPTEKVNCLDKVSSAGSHVGCGTRIWDFFFSSPHRIGSGWNGFPSPPPASPLFQGFFSTRSRCPGGFLPPLPCGRGSSPTLIPGIFPRFPLQIPVFLGYFHAVGPQGMWVPPTPHSPLPTPFSRGDFHVAPPPCPGGPRSPRCPQGPTQRGQGWSSLPGGLRQHHPAFPFAPNIFIYSDISDSKAAQPCGGPRKATVNASLKPGNLIWFPLSSFFPFFFLLFFFPPLKSSIPIDTSPFQNPIPYTPGLPPFTWRIFFRTFSPPNRSSGGGEGDAGSPFPLLFPWDFLSSGAALLPPPLPGFWDNQFRD